MIVAAAIALNPHTVTTMATSQFTVATTIVNLAVVAMTIAVEFLHRAAMPWADVGILVSNGPFSNHGTQRMLLFRR